MSTEKSVYEERIQELEGQLQKAKDSLQKYKTDHEEFLLIASHDLQAPLRKLSTYVERLTSKIKDVPDDVKNYSERIEAAVTNMRSLIDGLSALSHVTETPHIIDKCDLNNLLQKAIKDISCETAVNINSTLPVIEGNCIQLKHLFQNLIDNAIKFQKKDGSLQIIIDAIPSDEKEKQDLNLPAEKMYYKIEIKDNGIGFDQKYCERIFQPFQRLHGKSEYEGTGLGLSICKKIVEKHQGIIYATGSNEGARFILILPETAD